MIPQTNKIVLTGKEERRIANELEKIQNAAAASGLRGTSGGSVTKRVVTRVGKPLAKEVRSKTARRTGVLRSSVRQNTRVWKRGKQKG
ncbi:MAG: hypothetical protein OXE50_16185, partial [Chloroflexi bacterium]|nr:hypothetical protein [Chloroflexota bacterium]